jgi:hypothetical protein
MPHDVKVENNVESCVNLSVGNGSLHRFRKNGSSFGA